MAIRIEIKALKSGVSAVDSPQVFDSSEILVGRKADNNLVLPDTQVSGKHLKISLKGELVFLDQQ